MRSCETRSSRAPPRTPEGPLRTGGEAGGYPELAADGLMPKAELAAKLGLLNAEIAALGGEADALSRAAEKETGD